MTSSKTLNPEDDPRAWLQDALSKLQAEFTDKRVIEQTYGHGGKRRIDGVDVWGTGKGYDTTGIKYQAVVDRLNEVLGLEGWRQEVRVLREETETTRKDKTMHTVTSEVTLRVGFYSKTRGEWVELTQRVSPGGHSSLEFGSAHKGAMTNALKKCAALLGVGREAYLGTIDDDHTPPGAGDDGRPPRGDSAPPQRRPAGNQDRNPDPDPGGWVEPTAEEKEKRAHWQRIAEYKEAVGSPAIARLKGADLDHGQLDGARELVARLDAAYSSPQQAARRVKGGESPESPVPEEESDTPWGEGPPP